jgi:LDH2 family malate/lactate/ureidoglycolate dehydrogenase
MLKSVEELRKISEEALLTAGAPQDEARIIADCLIEAELRGRPTHGLIRFAGIIRRVKERAGKKPRIIKDEGYFIHLDGQGGIGYVTAFYAMKLAMERAREKGLCLAGVRNAAHCGMLGYFVWMAAKEDLVGMMTADCNAFVAPYGGSEKVFGTNPIAFGIPAIDFPIIIDMGTSAVTWGDLIIARRRGEKIPAGVALDSSGNPTTDPEEARAGMLLPFGGHKGYCFGLLVQILSGAFVGAATIPQGGKNYGYFLQVINPEIFTAIDVFKKEMAELVRAIKAVKPLPEFAEVLIPGERAAEERQARLAQGIEIDEKLLAELEGLVA